MNMQSQPSFDRDRSPVGANETFGGTWPFKARYSKAPGFNMHYVDQGAGDETLLLLHGEPTWTYLFRRQIAAWSKFARVIAVDHMGFGKSDTPSERTYWLQDHVENLEAFVVDLNLQRITLVMHDFGGPVGMGLAASHPERIKRIISVNGPTPFGQPDLLDRVMANAGASPWFKWIGEAERKGILEQVLGHLDFNILSTLKLNGFEQNHIITDDWIEAYRAPFATPEDALGAIGWAKGFATGQHVFRVPAPGAKDAIGAKPALLIWGEKDRTLQAANFLPLFEQIFPKGKVQLLPQAGHYSLEDAPDEIIDLVMSFLQEAPCQTNDATAGTGEPSGQSEDRLIHSGTD